MAGPEGGKLVKFGMLPAFFSFLSHRKALVLGTSVGLFFVLVYRSFIKEVVLILILAIIGIFSTYYKRLTRVPPAVELITFGTVMVGLAYGPLMGALFGAIVTIIAEVFNSGIDFFIVGYVPARAIVGAVSSFFPGSSIIVLGSSMSLLYNAVAQPLYAFQSDAELRLKLLAFVLVNVSFNFLAFTLLGGPVKDLIM